MSRNRELVERWMAEFAGDRDVFQETLHPDIVWFPFEDNHTPSHGIEAAMRVRDGWLDSWEEMHAEIEDLVEQGDSVVASTHVRARGRASGVEVDVRLYLHFRVRDGT